MEITAADLLRYLMIPGTCMGFRQLEMAINLAVEDENRLLNVVENLYALMAADRPSPPLRGLTVCGGIVGAWSLGEYKAGRLS